MRKKILVGCGVVTGIAVIVIAIAVYYFLPSENTILSFIKDNPAKSSILLIRNDTILAISNSDRVMPLASTMKIIVAIEYAEQASQGKINPDEYVKLGDLDLFYVANTDGDAHPQWLKSVKKKIKDDQVTIREIAKGMIKFSSNANTEWLLERLGSENVNGQIAKLGLQHHTEIYYLVSALFVGREAFPDMKSKELKDKLRGLSSDQYIGYINTIHDKLKSDTSYRKKLENLGLDIQRVWSDRLPSSTVTDYVSIMKKINDRNYFDPMAQQYLDEVMEYILENPANQKWLGHAGMKGGSTAFVLTKALYATDKKGNKTTLAYFFNDLSITEMTKLQMSMNEFELKVLTSDEFRRKF